MSVMRFIYDYIHSIYLVTGWDLNVCQIPVSFAYNFACEKSVLINLLLTAVWEEVKAQWACCGQVIYKVRGDNVIKWT